MSKEFLKKIGILGVSFGLIASPLAFAAQDDEYEPMDPAPQEEPAPDVDTNSEFDNDEFDNDDFETEYEDEEQEDTLDDDEEWDVPAEDEEQSW
ncbi:hypothetical protein HIO72_11360 [Halomonas sp. PA5]|nr:hypothetical protein HIO72_11360 [Halomonas sp. PA5]